MRGRRAKQERRLERAGALPAAPGAPWTADLLDRGRGAGDYVLRQARAGDWPRLRELIPLSGAPVEELVGDSLRSGLAATQVRAALKSSKEGHLVMAKHLRAQDVQSVALAMSIAIVAQPPEGEVAGVCLMMPAAQPIQSLIDMGAEFHQLTMMFMALKKVRAVAVDPAHRGAGLGRRLVMSSTNLARQAGSVVVYGQFKEAEHLEAFYAGCGFEVLAPRQGISLQWLLDAPHMIMPERGERMFVMGHH